MEQQAEEQQKPFFDSLIEFIIKLKPFALQAWAGRKQLIIFNGSIFIITILYLLFITKPYFQSTITILPDFGNKSSEVLSQFSGIAALAGVNVGDNPPTQIYQNLITSETVLGGVIYAKYQTKEFDQPVDLIEYFKIKPDKSLPDSLQKRKMFLGMYESLVKSRIVANYDRLTKILGITVEMPESQLSADVANKLVRSLNSYILTQRKSFATEQRKYLEGRVKQIKDTLTMYEEILKDFRSTNRQVAQSPELQLEQARLMRNVEIQQSIYAELTKQLELVKLAEVKDTPVVNVREYAKEPILKTGPKRTMTLIGMLFISFLCSLTWILVKKKVYDGINLVRNG